MLKIKKNYLVYLNNFKQNDPIIIDGVNISDKYWLSVYFVKHLSSYKFEVKKVIVGDKTILFAYSKKSDNSYAIYTFKEKKAESILRTDENYKKLTKNAEDIFYKKFEYLINDYGMKYAYNNYDVEVDKYNNIIGFSTYSAYSFYNSDGCITFLYSHKDDSFDVINNEKYSNKQADIRNGIGYGNGASILNSELRKDYRFYNIDTYTTSMAMLVKEKIEKTGHIFNVQIKKKGS